MKLIIYFVGISQLFSENAKYVQVCRNFAKSCATFPEISEIAKNVQNQNINLPKFVNSVSRPELSFKLVSYCDPSEVRPSPCRREAPRRELGPPELGAPLERSRAAGVELKTAGISVGS